jgi:hypothetical protein
MSDGDIDRTMHNQRELGVLSHRTLETIVGRRRDRAAAGAVTPLWLEWPGQHTSRGNWIC